MLNIKFEYWFEHRTSVHHSKMVEFVRCIIFVSIFLIFIDILDGTFALHINKLSFPKGIELECDYDLVDETLYEVKWYKDNQEFFQYTPNDEPVTKVFEVREFKLNFSDKIELFYWNHLSMDRFRALPLTRNWKYQETVGLNF